MKNLNYGRLFALTAILVLALLLPHAAYAAKPIKIGALWGLGGLAAVYTKPAVAGMEMAIDEINAKGGVLGRPLSLIVRDTQLKPDVALREARSLLFKEEVDFLAGTISSAVALAVSELAKENKVLFLCGISQTAALTEEKGHRYVVRTTTNTTTFARSAALFIQDKPFTKLYMMGPDYEYGHRGVEDTLDYLKKIRPDVKVIGEAWPKFGERDFSSYITAIIEAKPDLVISWIWGGDAIAFIRQAIPFGFFEKVKYLSVAAGDLDVAVPLKDEMPEGIYGSAYYLPYYPETKENLEFAKKYMDRTKEFASNGSLSGYNVVNFLAAAIKKAGSANTEKVIDAIRGLSLNTPIGPFKIRDFDGQSTAPYMWGITARSPKYPFATLKDIVVVPGEKVLKTKEEIMKARGQ